MQGIAEKEKQGLFEGTIVVDIEFDTVVEITADSGVRKNPLRREHREYYRQLPVSDKATSCVSGSTIVAASRPGTVLRPGSLHRALGFSDAN